MKPLPEARFGSKLSDSLVAAGRGVNTQFPFGVAEGTPIPKLAATAMTLRDRVPFDQRVMNGKPELR